MNEEIPKNLSHLFQLKAGTAPGLLVNEEIPKNLSHLFQLKVGTAPVLLAKVDSMLEKHREAELYLQRLAEGCRGNMLAEKYQVPCPGAFGQFPSSVFEGQCLLLKLREIRRSKETLCIRGSIVSLHFLEKGFPVLGSRVFVVGEYALKTMSVAGHIQKTKGF